MSHGIYHLEPNQEELSQLAAIVLPATITRVGGIMPGPSVQVAADGTLSLSPATPSLVGGVKVGAGLAVAPDGTLSWPPPAWQTWTPAIIGDGPYTPTWTLAQYRTDGVMCDIAVVVTVNIQKVNRVQWWFSWPITPTVDAWPIRAVCTTASSPCFAFIDKTTGGICIDITSGNMPTGTQTFHIDGDYRVS